MKYYSTQRPVTPGSFPKPVGNRIIEIVNFDSREEVEAIGRNAWGYIEYENPLTEQQARSYELTPETAREERFPEVEEYMTAHDFIPADKLKVRKFLEERQAIDAIITRRDIRYKDRTGIIGKIGRGMLGIQDNFV